MIPLDPSDHQLSRLLTPEIPSHWSDADLAAMLAHQLSAPLAETLLAANLLDPSAARQLTADIGPQIRHALTHPHPPRELLHALKLLGKSPPDPADPALAQISRLLYFAAIAAARVRLQVSLSALPDSDLRAATLWALSLPWLSPDLRPLFQASLDAPPLPPVIL
jgi:hypothetical protein